MKCDRRWYNDGRVELEGEELSVRYWTGRYPFRCGCDEPGRCALCTPVGGAPPFWQWWIVSDAADDFRRARERLLGPIIRIVASSGSQ